MMYGTMKVKVTIKSNFYLFDEKNFIEKLIHVLID